MNKIKSNTLSFIVLLLLVSLAFVWILLPFYGTIFWAAILAILFTPINRHLTVSLGQRKNLAAIATLLLIVIIVLLPVFWTATALVQEGLEVYKRIDNGDLRIGERFAQIMQIMPTFVHDMLESAGFGDLQTLRDKLSGVALQGSKFIASRAVSFGQNTFSFVVSTAVMLYLLFFLLRDGRKLAEACQRVVPLSPNHQQLLIQKFITVVRATVKGNVLIAALQGALGGLMFWILGIQGALLWAVVMAVLSLLPAVGASLVWLPVAIYFFATGMLWQAIVLTAFGIFVIGLIDSLLRPLLVGKDTKLPDYIILISTLGGMAVFGLNGFVIGPLVAALFMACWDVLPSTLSNNIT